MNPPPGCPFQTRCRWKSEVPGDLCDREVPPMVQVAEGHQIKCHLSKDKLAQMEPVFEMAPEAAE
jgi:peptide/nickel transport system ATP-binding protein